MAEVLSSTFLCFAQKVAWDRREASSALSFNLAIAALAAIRSASFLLCPLPRPATSPFRSTSTKKRLSWSGLLASQAAL